jgi:hypothetical protein
MGTNTVMTGASSVMPPGMLGVMWGVGTPPRAVGLPGDSGGPLLNDGYEVSGVCVESGAGTVNMSGRPTYLGSYVDVNDPATRKFLKDTAQKWSANVPSLFRTPGASGGVTPPTTVTPPK